MTDNLPTSSLNAPSPAARESRILEFDGLRGFAAVLVLLHHFAGQWVNAFPLGTIGLRLFFVLSGYLITGILLEHRRKIDQDPSAFKRRLGHFYGRRALRLLPVLYLGIIALNYFNLGIAHNSWPWDVSYLSNFFAMRRSINRLAPAVGHLWSLSIEEQFYILWPWIIFMMPRRFLGPFIITIIAIAPLYRSWGWLLHWRWTIIYCMPIGAWDALGLGALLIFCEREKPQWSSNLETFRIAALIISTPAVTLGLWLMHFSLFNIRQSPRWGWATLHVQFYRQAVTDTMLALFAFGVIGHMRRFPQGLLNQCLRWRPLVYLGTVSYGLYVYHIPMKQFYQQYIEHKFAVPQEGSITYFFLMSAISIGLATVSWFLMEKPISRLKHRLKDKSGTRGGRGSGEWEVDVDTNVALHERPA